MLLQGVRNPIVESRFSVDIIGHSILCGLNRVAFFEV